MRLSALVYRFAGLAAVALGLIGVLVPLMPSVVFFIFAAYCFARSNPAWEARLLAHRRLGPHIAAWRTRGAIARSGKQAAVAALASSAALGFILLEGWLSLVPVGVALVVASWVASRPTA